MPRKGPVQPRPDVRVSLDLVVPLWNEEEVLDLLFERLGSVFSVENLERAGIRSIRYI